MIDVGKVGKLVRFVKFFFGEMLFKKRYSYLGSYFLWVDMCRRGGRDFEVSRLERDFSK